MELLDAEVTQCDGSLEVKPLDLFERLSIRGYALCDRFTATGSRERNGNGRDFDIIPSFAGDYAHGYVLNFDLVPVGPGKVSMLLHSSGYYVEGNSNLRVFLRQDEIRKRFPDFALNQPYTVRATLILDVGNGGQSGYWSDAFIERVFPIRERSQSVTREIRF